MTEQPHLADGELLLLAEEGEGVGDLASRPSATAHLARCEACRTRLQHLTELDEALRGRVELDWASDARHARLRARLQQRMTETATAGPWSIARLRESPAGAVLTVVVLVAIGAIVTRTPVRRTGPLDHTTTRLAPARALPIASITPGATIALSADVLCSQLPLAPSPIPDAVRVDVLRAYGMEQIADHEYELDYLITPDLGGAPDPRNLWPEPYHSPVWNARVKDELETLLPRLVCEGKVDLRTAQRDIAADWIAAYKKYFKTDRPLRRS